MSSSKQLVTTAQSYRAPSQNMTTWLGPGPAVCRWFFTCPCSWLFLVYANIQHLHCKSSVKLTHRQAKGKSQAGQALVPQLPLNLSDPQWMQSSSTSYLSQSSRNSARHLPVPQTLSLLRNWLRTPENKEPALLPGTWSQWFITLPLWNIFQVKGRSGN